MSAQLIEEIKTMRDGLGTQITEGLARVQTRIDRMEAEYLRPDGGGGNHRSETKLLGDVLAADEEVKRFLQVKRGYLRIPVQNLFVGEQKAILSGTLVAPDRDNRIVGEPRRALRLRDIIRIGRPTDSNKVDYLRETGFTNAASPQVEASLKGESSMTLEVDSADVQTIAHWITASRQALDDVTGLQQFVNGRMLYSLKVKEEQQLLAGDGTGVNLNGIIPQATPYNTGYNGIADTKVDKLRHAIMQLELADFEADAIVLNPRDWHDCELIKDEAGGFTGSGSYVASDPLGGTLTVPTLWGKAVIKSNSMAYGQFLVGAFSTAAEIRDRQNAVIDISFEHQDYFVKNLVAVRCEQRLTIVVQWPEAFIYGSL